jgi:hypothetical protein
MRFSFSVLPTTSAVMSDDCLTVREAWDVYDRWLKSTRVGLRREAPETKAIGDCYLLAASTASAATLVTFDRGFLDLARRVGYDVLLLA